MSNGQPLKIWGLFFIALLSCVSSFAVTLPIVKSDHPEVLLQGPIVMVSSDKSALSFEGSHKGIDYMLAHYKAPRPNALEAIARVNTALAVSDSTRVEPIHNINELASDTYVNRRGQVVLDPVKLRRDNVALVYFDNSASGSKMRVFDAGSMQSPLPGVLSMDPLSDRATVTARHTNKTSYISVVHS